VCRCRNNRSPEPNERYICTQRWTLLKSPALLFQCRYAFAVPPSLHDGNGWGIRIDEPLTAIGQRFAMCRMAAKPVRVLSTPITLSQLICLVYPAFSVSRVIRVIRVAFTGSRLEAPALRSRYGSMRTGCRLQPLVPACQTRH
jgi:hypothetical protein